MSKRVKFFYNGILLTLVGFAMRAAGLFLGAYISGAIGAEGVGLSGLITTVYAFAVTFATSGVFPYMAGLPRARPHARRSHRPLRAQSRPRPE